MSLASWGLKSVELRRVRISYLAILYRARLRRRWVSELMAVLGIAVGVALVYAAHVASTSLSAPVHSLNSGIVGDSQLQVASRGGTFISRETYNKVLAVDGVKQAAPVVQVPGNVVGPRGQRGVLFYGADPRIVKLRGELLAGFSGNEAAEQEAVVLSTAVGQAIGARVGDDINVELNGRRLRVPVIVAGHRDIGALADTALALVPLRYLQRLARAGDGVSGILVQAAPGRVDAVRRDLTRAVGGRQNVVNADNESKLFDKAARPTSQATTVFSVLAALVGWLFALCALLVTASDRRALAVEQRYEGQPTSVTVVTLMFDAAIVGTLGVCVGLPLGELISRQGFSSDVSFLSGAFPIGDQRVVSWDSFVIAAIGGFVAAAIGVLLPLRHDIADTRLRRRPGSTADRHEQVGARLPVAGIGCLIVAVLLAAFAPTSIVFSVVLVGVSLGALLPTMLTGAIAGARWVSRRVFPGSWAWTLALQHLQAARWRPRAIAIALTGAVAVFGASTLGGTQRNLQAGLDVVSGGVSAPADLWAAPGGAGSAIAVPSFEPSAANRLERVPGVQRVGFYRAGLLDIAGHRAWVIGQPADVRSPLPPQQAVDGDLDKANGQIRRGGWVAVSRDIAASLHLAVGDRLTLPSTRPVALRVAAISTNLGWSGGAITMNSADFARAWDRTSISAYQIHLTPGTSADELKAQVRRALGRRSALRVETATQRSARQKAISRGGLARLGQISTMTLVAAVLAMCVAMVGLLWQHRPVIRSLKYDGADTGLVWKMLLIETGVLFGTGAVIGALFSLVGQALAAPGVEMVTGFPVVHEVRVGVAAQAAGVVIAASLAALLVPGYYIARTRPAWR